VSIEGTPNDDKLKGGWLWYYIRWRRQWQNKWWERWWYNQWRTGKWHVKGWTRRWQN
jgi:hypothetical protein